MAPSRYSITIFEQMRSCFLPTLPSINYFPFNSHHFPSMPRTLSILSSKIVSSASILVWLKFLHIISKMFRRGEKILRADLHQTEGASGWLNPLVTSWAESLIVVRPSNSDLFQWPTLSSEEMPHQPLCVWLIILPGSGLALQFMVWRLERIRIC